jgi:hypothetical protein
VNLAEPQAPAQRELRPISHRLATALLVGDAAAVPHAHGWPSPGLRHRLRASAIWGEPAGWLIVDDGVVVGDCVEPTGATSGSRRPWLTVA